MKHEPQDEYLVQEVFPASELASRLGIKQEAEAIDRNSYCDPSMLTDCPHTMDAPPPWLIGFAPRFRRDTTALDRKLLGRVLEILQSLSQTAPPFQPHGDSFKPLSANLNGQWRYRIGDWRLIIQPNIEERRIDVLAFASRGSAYD